MAVATWWRGDSLPQLSPLLGFRMKIIVRFGSHLITKNGVTATSTSSYPIGIC